MANNTPKPKDKLSSFQKAAVGIFISTAAVYELLIKSTELQKSLGGGYLTYLSGLTMFGLTCAAFSGPQILELVSSIKEFLSKKKE